MLATISDVLKCTCCYCKQPSATCNISSCLCTERPLTHCVDKWHLNNPPSATLPVSYYTDVAQHTCVSCVRYDANQATLLPLALSALPVLVWLEFSPRCMPLCPSVCRSRRSPLRHSGALIRTSAVWNAMPCRNFARLGVFVFVLDTSIRETARTLERKTFSRAAPPTHSCRAENHFTGPSRVGRPSEGLADGL